LELTILILLILSLGFNILIAIVLVRFHEGVDVQHGKLMRKIDQQDLDIRKLSQELVSRLPPMPYDENQNGSYDGRIR